MSIPSLRQQVAEAFAVAFGCATGGIMGAKVGLWLALVISGIYLTLGVILDVLRRRAAFSWTSVEPPTPEDHS